MNTLSKIMLTLCQQTDDNHSASKIMKTSQPATHDNPSARRSQREVAITARERGSATLWGVALMGLLMAVAMAFATVGVARVARHRVDNAADLSALAAAKLALFDPEGACARASEVAAQNGARLTRCEINGEVADIWTALPVSLPVVGTRTATGRSRAGPAAAISPELLRPADPVRR